MMPHKVFPMVENAIEQDSLLEYSSYAKFEEYAEERMAQVTMQLLLHTK